MQGLMSLFGHRIDTRELPDISSLKIKSAILKVSCLKLGSLIGSLKEYLIRIRGWLSRVCYYFEKICSYYIILFFKANKVTEVV